MNQQNDAPYLPAITINDMTCGAYLDEVIAFYQEYYPHLVTHWRWSLKQVENDYARENYRAIGGNPLDYLITAAALKILLQQEKLEGNNG